MRIKIKANGMEILNIGVLEILYRLALRVENVPLLRPGVHITCECSNETTTIFSHEIITESVDD